MERKILTPDKRDNGYVKDVCLTIMQQMKWPNINVYFSWGAHDFKYGVTEDKEPILTFKVDGHHYKGRVYIILDFSDTYRIEFPDTDKIESLSDVYCDELQEKIDERIEKIESYQF